MAEEHNAAAEAQAPDDRALDAKSREKPSFHDEAAYARIILKHRRLRDRVLAYDIFSEPAWDMLLDLFVSEIEGVRVSKSSLMIAAAVPQSTAMRWISNLVEARILRVEQDQNDGRRAFVSLSREVFDSIATLLGMFVSDRSLRVIRDGFR